MCFYILMDCFNWPVLPCFAAVRAPTVAACTWHNTAQGCAAVYASEARQGFLRRRTGSRDVPVVVEVEPDGFPEYVTPAPQLAELLGLPEGAATRQDVMHALWRYIRTHQLQARRAHTP